MSDLEIYHRNPAKRSKPLDLVLSTSTLDHMGRTIPVPTAEDRAKVARFAATHADSADELGEFLAMLGVSPQEGRA